MMDFGDRTSVLGSTRLYWRPRDNKSVVARIVTIGRSNQTLK
jgi:hypothetical protein